jgi:hypothetical protein
VGLVRSSLLGECVRVVVHLPQTGDVFSSGEPGGDFALLTKMGIAIPNGGIAVEQGKSQSAFARHALFSIKSSAETYVMV